MLAELVRDAIKDGEISEADLCGTEPALLAKLNADADYARRWAAFRAMHRTERSETDLGGTWRRIPAKKRCIDPLIVGLGRASDVSEPLRSALEAFRNAPQEEWINGFFDETE